MRVLFFVVIAVLVNLPYAHESWTDHQVRTQGRDVEAVVLKVQQVDGGYLVEYRLPRSVDAEQRTYSAAIDVETFEQAADSDRIAVRVVPGRPNANRPQGLVESSLFTVIAIVGDVTLLLAAGLLWYRRRNPEALPSAP